MNNPNRIIAQLIEIAYRADAIKRVARSGLEDNGVIRVPAAEYLKMVDSLARLEEIPMAEHETFSGPTRARVALESFLRGVPAEAGKVEAAYSASSLADEYGGDEISLMQPRTNHYPPISAVGKIATDPVIKMGRDSVIGSVLKDPVNRVAHVLFKDGDVPVPDQILDSNRQVVLNLCKLCDRAEAELEGPCLDPANYNDWIKGMHVFSNHVNGMEQWLEWSARVGSFNREKAIERWHNTIKRTYAPVVVVQPAQREQMNKLLVEVKDKIDPRTAKFIIAGTGVHHMADVPGVAIQQVIDKCNAALGMIDERARVTPASPPPAALTWPRTPLDAATLAPAFKAGLKILDDAYAEQPQASFTIEDALACTTELIQGTLENDDAARLHTYVSWLESMSNTPTELASDAEGFIIDGAMQTGFEPIDSNGDLFVVNGRNLIKYTMMQRVRTEAIHAMPVESQPVPEQHPDLNEVAAAIKYPAEWDTTTYPTLASALHEITECNKDENDAIPKPPFSVSNPKYVPNTIYVIGVGPEGAMRARSASHSDDILADFHVMSSAFELNNAVKLRNVFVEPIKVGALTVMSEWPGPYQTREIGEGGEWVNADHMRYLAAVRDPNMDTRLNPDVLKDWMVVMVVEDMKKRLAYGSMDEAAIGAYEVLAELNAISRIEPHAGPVDMIIHCPACGVQHIDAPENHVVMFEGVAVDEVELWDNPPHRSHLCHGCGHIWRPADVPTNGVKSIMTASTSDSPVARPLIYPATFDKGLQYILGTMSFNIVRFVEQFRKNGHDIPTKAEAEQAFMIDRMLRAYLAYGADGWNAAVNRDMKTKITPKEPKA